MVGFLLLQNDLVLDRNKLTGRRQGLLRGIHVIQQIHRNSNRRQGVYARVAKTSNDRCARMNIVSNHFEMSGISTSQVVAEVANNMLKSVMKRRNIKLLDRVIQDRFGKQRIDQHHVS